MNNIWQIKNLGEWIISNLVWEFVALGFVLIFLRFLPGFIQAIIISRKILKGNRDTRGNSWGKYSADRFIDIWYSNPKIPLSHEVGKFYYKTFNNPNSRHWMDVIDRELEGLKLIEIFDNRDGHKVVRPVKNWRNSLIAVLVKFSLVNFIGDNIQYYRDMKEQSRK